MGSRPIGSDPASDQIETTATTSNGLKEAKRESVEKNKQLQLDLNPFRQQQLEQLMPDEDQYQRDSNQDDTQTMRHMKSLRRSSIDR